MSQRLKDQQQAMIQHEKMVALGQMAAGVAHEIANPLASMDTLVELMLRHPERGGPARLELLREQARRMKQILQQMTTFAHPAHAHGALLSVNAAVKAALAIIRFDPRMRRVHLVRDLSPEADAVQVDSRGMEQVVVNLVINALDAMENTAAPRLAVRTVCEGGGCLIEVSDNGHGIAPEHLDHIFEPFFTTKPVGKGTGLGLAVSYSLVRRLGGSVEVRSEVGKGSVFAIRWPARAVVSYPRESAAV
jgi:C4-dicarboxylate-specific signal transduction histidine kinase